MGQIKLVITDLDGTLFNTLEANKAAYKAAAEYLGLEWTDELYEKNFGLNWKDMTKALGVPEDKAKELHDRKAVEYVEHFDLIKVNFDLLDFLFYMKEQETKICIATTAATENVVNLLNYFELYDEFDFIITADNIKGLRGKPYPDIYFEALKAAGGITPDEAIVFEDSEVGMEAAKAAGINYIKIDMTKIYKDE